VHRDMQFFSDCTGTQVAMILPSHVPMDVYYYIESQYASRMCCNRWKLLGTSSIHAGRGEY
jgi:hypothetical protein